MKHSKFDNSSLRLPFGKEVVAKAGKPVPGTQMVDLRSQALRRTPAELLRNLRKRYEPRLSAGIWFFGEGSSRFHGSYKEEMPLSRRLEIAAEMAEYGLRGIEAHYPWEINEENLDQYLKLGRQAGVKVTGVAGIGGDFRAVESRFGTISSTVGATREKYLDSTVAGLRFTQKVSKKQGQPANAIMWPGIDGYTYSLGTDFYDMWDRSEAALAEAMDEVPGVRVAIEPKPYEPAINNIYRNTPDGILMGHDVEGRLRSSKNLRLLKQGHALIGLNPEIGHVRMGFEDVAYSYARVLREGRLAHVHVNGQPMGNFDQDLNPGTVGIETTEALMFVLRMYGFAGYLGMDLNPDKMDVRIALANSFNELCRANAVIDNLDCEGVLAAYFDPENNEGVVEALLARARAKAVSTSDWVSLSTIRKWGRSD